MRNIVKICAALTVLVWIGSSAAAFGQAVSSGSATTTAPDPTSGRGSAPEFASGAPAPATGGGATSEPVVQTSPVSPMAVTTPPGSYYAGQPASVYGTAPVTPYNPAYVTPGAVAPGRTYYYTTPTQTYMTRPRRGLFGRRYQQVYTTAPYGYSSGIAPRTYVYPTTPGTYTYAPVPY